MNTISLHIISDNAMHRNIQELCDSLDQCNITCPLTQSQGIQRVLDIIGDGPQSQPRYQSTYQPTFQPAYQPDTRAQPHGHDTNQKILCRYFLKGSCDNDRCQYLHSRPSSKDNRADNMSRQTQICKYHTSGGCTNPECRYLHPVANKNKVSRSNDNMSRQICRYHTNGGCTNPKCQYLHPEAQRKAPVGPEVQRRVPLGSEVQRKAPVGPEVQRRVPVCKYFLQGRCTNRQCAFLHEAAPDVVNQTKATKYSPVVSREPAISREEPIYRESESYPKSNMSYQLCTRGNACDKRSCKHAHPKQLCRLGAKCTSGRCSYIHPNEILCMFHLQGGCRNGNACQYSHQV